MAALDFPASPTLNQLATLTNGFTYQWDGAVWTLAASTGQQAGGDLTGTYPNPLIGPGAVGNAEISDVAYGKITGAPVALPPSGAAGGDLSGTYPAPVVAKASGEFTVAGQVTAGGSVLSGISQGAAALNAGGAGNTGFLSWLNAAGARCGYIGYGNGTRLNLICNENSYTGIDVAGTVNATLTNGAVGINQIAYGAVDSNRIAGGATIRQSGIGYFTGSFSVTGNANWTPVGNTGWMYGIRQNACVLVLVTVGAAGVFGSGTTFYYGIGSNGSVAQWHQQNWATNVSTVMPSMLAWMSPRLNAGDYYWQFFMWANTGAIAGSTSPGNIQAFEFS